MPSARLMMGEVSAGFGGILGEYAAEIGSNGAGILVDEIQQSYRESTASDFLKKRELSEREALYVVETYGGDLRKMEDLFKKDYEAFLKQCRRDGVQPETRLEGWLKTKQSGCTR